MCLSRRHAGRRGSERQRPRGLVNLVELDALYDRPDTLRQKNMRKANFARLVLGSFLDDCDVSHLIRVVVIELNQT